MISISLENIFFTQNIAIYQGKCFALGVQYTDLNCKEIYFRRVFRNHSNICDKSSCQRS